MKKQTHHFWFTGLLSLWFLVKPAVIQAQVTSDGTLSTQVQSTNNLNFTISNGNQVGSNLFHSFREFSVPTGGSAFFANSLDVQNIISRVTGNSLSNINGSIKSNGSANLFLINPNGIIFGPNASLSINGSFVASTASHLLFADGTEFSATNPQTPPLLTVSIPLGLQFGQTANPIQTEGSKLRVLPGKTLAMLGGDVLIKGGELIAPAGRIELGSVPANSRVGLTPIAAGWALGYDGVLNFQDIRVSQAASVSTTGQSNGAIQLRGREIAMADRSQVGGRTLGRQPGQPLVIKASESVEVSGRSQLRTLTLGSGAAGDILIETKRLIVRNGGFIDASTGGSGSGGNLTVDASESVEILGTGVLTSIGTRTLDLPNNIGNAGTVQISTRNLVLRDGGQIPTSTFGAGKGGTLRVDASESIEVSGRTVVSGNDRVNLPSGLFAESITIGLTAATGQGGDLILNTPRLVVQGGASISVGAINGSTGQAGILDINASDSVTVRGSGIDKKGQVVPSTLLAASQGSGSAGDLRVNTGRLTVRDGAAISVSSGGLGRAGNLQITANELLLDNRGKLTAETTAGQGNIILRSRDLILRRGSEITTNATGSNNIGGNITIDTNNLAAVPQEDSDISANSRGFRGGNVTINASGIFGIQLRDRDTPLSDITATGQDSALNGTVQINIRDVNPSSGLVQLPDVPIPPTQLVAQGCPAKQGNTFTITGRGGLPSLPNEALRTNNTVPLNWVTLDSQESGVRARGLSHSPPRLPYHQPPIEATGWVINNSGEVVLIAAVPAAIPNSSGSTPASCPAP